MTDTQIPPATRSRRSPSSLGARRRLLLLLAVIAVLPGTVPLSAAAAATAPAASTPAAQHGGPDDGDSADHADHAFGHPVAPIDVVLRQPDGTTVPARPWGHGARTGYEGREGHTLVQEDDGRWVYAAAVAPDGELAPSSRSAESPPAPGLPKHLRPTVDDEAPLVHAPASGPTTGTQHQLVLLTQFADRPSVGTTAAQWSTRFFGATGSVRDLYRTASSGRFDLAPAAESSGTSGDGVVGWLTLPTGHPDPGQSGSSSASITAGALAAADPYVDFSSYDLDGDGKVAPEELHITVVVAGYDMSYGGPAAVCGPSVWGHRTALVSPVWADGSSVGTGGYTQFGEWHCAAGSGSPGQMATLGILAHELGHDLGWPDLYDVDGSSEGIGQWSLMASGSWATVAGQPAGSRPTLPDAFSRYYQGWVTPTAHTGPATGVAIDDAATTGQVVLVGTNPGGVDWSFRTRSGSGEYFLLENRQRVGHDAGLPGCGVLVWHVDESAPFSRLANADDRRRLVDLLEADGQDHLDSRVNRGDAGDPLTGALGRAHVDGTTHPDTRTNAGAQSGVSVHVTSPGCARRMTVDLMGAAPAAPAAPANDAFAAAQTLDPTSSGSVTGTNALATREAGEPRIAGDAGGSSVWYRWTSPVTGRVRIDTTASSGLRDSLLGVYTGTSVGSLALVADNDDEGPGTLTSQVDVDAVAGRTYAIAVDGYAGGGPADTGTLTLRWAGPDVDGDGVGDDVDVCPGVADPGQVDGDGDGAGDVCDDVVDVSSASPAYPFVRALIDAGVTAGCGGTSGSVRFCPEGEVTRSQMAIFLLRAAGISQDGSDLPAYAGTFSDVPDGYAARFVEELSRRGVTGGCAVADGPVRPRFCPDPASGGEAGLVTRQQMAIFLLRTAGVAPDGSSLPAFSGTFQDVPDGFSARFVEELSRRGITGGCVAAPLGGRASYCPSAKVTRSAMAIFLVRTFGLPLPT